ncbi:GNAT family N-acetyltransferase [Phenylobacterium sp. 20VBR1]|uniref:GNAT family N-acetyltransferase n=1 Tax=Phenylobacterium glaciei TaxID=2803784 RepID=A0A941CXJ0_9CAUL|nr:GNAT family N-acetyltransferase [Phenylobacterium glaciei]MBR7618177.1 GNAT family N-acetyltransferase [Phenylobacterium glaciei]
MLVRRVRPEELPIAAAIYQKVLRETFTWLPGSRHNAQVFLRDARDEDVYVAVADHRILGVAALYTVDSFLHSLYVAQRGQGVGKALLDHVTAAAPDALSLKCQTANLRARAFYAREGFKEVGQGDDGVPWVKMARPSTAWT